MKKMMTTAYLTLLLLIVTLSASAAEIPGSIDRSARLVNPQQLMDKPMMVTLSLYPSESARIPIWTEHHRIREGGEGYTVVLDSIPFNRISHGRYYLGIEIETKKGTVCLGRRLIAAQAIQIKEGL